MEKLLTVSVAAYNVGETLKQCLNSCIDAGKSNLLEVIVVDDGSTDDTAQIALEYEKVYPDTFRVLLKENGGYGTTVNASLTVAKGKYYKLLDGDDWFDPDALTRLIATLENCTADVVVSPFVKQYSNRTELIDQARLDVVGLQCFRGDYIPDVLNMHSITYKTCILRAIQFELPAHRLYTDALYATIPLQFISTTYVLHDPLYQYRLGTEGQSVSLKSYEMHHEDLSNLVDDLIVQYLALEDHSTLSSRILLNWIAGSATKLLKVLYTMHPTDGIWKEIKILINKTRINPSIEEACLAKGKAYRFFVHIPYSIYPIVSRCYRIFSQKTRLVV